MLKLNLLFLSVFSFSFANAELKNLDNKSDTLPRILIANSFDAFSLNVRKNKKELFKELSDSLKIYLEKIIRTHLGLDAIIIPGTLNSSDSSIHSMMQVNHATRAIVIHSLEVYFNEGTEKHTEQYGTSPKIETSYDLCSKIDYTFYMGDSTSKTSQVNLCDYFTTRSVNDKGLVIKFGPDIVGKKKHTYGAVEKNAENYISSIAYLARNTANQ